MISLYYDKPTKTFYARWRQPQPDGSVKFPSVKLMRRSDRYHSKADVKKSDQYKTLLARFGEPDFDAKHAKLLLTVAEVRGKDKPDALDAAVVERLISDDSDDSMMLATFVETVYFPNIEARLRGKTVREYRSLWNRYKIAEKVSGLRVRDFETKHGKRILESIAAKHDVSKPTLQHVKFFLSGVFVLAKNEGLYKGLNPMQDVMLPEARGASETHAYTLDEILAMLRLPFGTTTLAVIGVAAFAGLRDRKLLASNGEIMTEPTFECFAALTA